tara:strand:+ start:778 stop:984 length:207 start_codon:yes stop_codon:yes gene_type:complete
MKNNIQRKKKTFKPSPGDILEDRHGNRMVIVDVVGERTGDCYVLLNGKVKLVNAKNSFIIKTPVTAGR